MFAFLIQFVFACNLPMKSLTIYPTEGELYRMPLQEIFNGNYLVYSCRGDCPKNVTILNCMNSIHQKRLDYTTVAISSNKTHFITLTNQSTAILHYFDYNKNIMTTFPHASIDPKLNCFNSLFTPKQQIILDCYNNELNILQFLYLNQSALILMQTFYNQSVPNKTKLLNFIQNEEVYLLYAQFWDQYEILTLFIYGDNQLINQTTWKQGLIDFDVSLQFLYIIDKIILYQVSINKKNQFEILFAFRSLFTETMQVIKVKNFYFSSSQCDFILILSYDEALLLMAFQAWNGSIILFSHGYNPELDQRLKPKLQIQFSEQFFICQFNNNFTVNQIGLPYFGVDYPYLATTNSLPIKLIYLEENYNYFFQFSDQIEIFSIHIPQLQIYSNDVELRKFNLYASSSGFFDLSCSLEITPQVLPKNDTNIYVTYDNSNIFHNVMQNTLFIYQLMFLSGPLLQPTGVLQNTNQGSFKNFTFQQLDIRFNQKFLITNLFYFRSTVINERYIKRQSLLENIFFVGATTNEIFFYFCKQDMNCKYLYNDQNLKLIANIQINFRYENTIVVAVDQGNRILIYNIDLFDNNTSKIYYEFSYYKQFVLTYDNIILLLNDEICIQSLIDSNQLSINQSIITQIFGTYIQNQVQFNPVNIQMNQADLSSILYINNGDSVIIVAIQNTRTIIPFSIIKFNQTIYQINIIQYLLIISYKCQQLICFEVFDVQNLLKPIYIKPLPSLQMQENWTIRSDNLFLYILNPSFTIQVINPSQPYHSSLFYEISFTGNYFSSISYNTYSIISFNNYIYKLNAIILQQFEPSKSTINQYDYFAQTYFNFNVTNSFQKQNQTQIEVLTIFNNLTSISFQNTLFQDFNDNQNYIIQLTSNCNISSSGQILGFKMLGKENFCLLFNYIELVNTFEYYPAYYGQPDLLMLNNTLLMQFGSQFYYVKFPSNQNQINFSEAQGYKMYSENFLKCHITTFYNVSIATQICATSENNISYYLTQFQFDCILNNCTFFKTTSARIPVQFSKIDKMTTINQKNHMILAQQLKLNVQLYVLHMNSTSKFKVIQVRSLRIPCTGGIKDFTILKLTEIRNYFIILYLCQNQLLWRIGQLKDDEFHISEGFFNQTLFTAENSLGSGELLQVLLLTEKYFTFLLMLTTSNAVNVIFTASYYVQNSTADTLNITLFLQQIVQTIPPYGNYTLVQADVIKGLLLLVFQSDYDQVYAIYDWLLMDNNITHPLMMKGGINLHDQLLTSLIFNITSSQDGGYMYGMNTTNIFVYQVQGNAYLDCTLGYHKNKSLTLLAYNSFQSGQLNIQFNYIQHNKWVIGLGSFVVSIFIIVIFIYWYKTKNIQRKESILEEEEKELGLEL